MSGNNPSDPPGARFVNLSFESERLRFDPLAMDDFDLIVDQWTDPEVVRYVGGETYTVDKLTEEMPKYVRRCADGCIGLWRLTVKATGEKLGTAALLPLPVELDDTDWDLLVGDDIPDGDIEVGYILKRAAWGKGYATEACTRMLRFAFEETPLDDIVACTDPANTASQNVLRKSGLFDLGMIRAYQSGVPGFRITRDEWLKRH